MDNPAVKPVYGTVAHRVPLVVNGILLFPEDSIPGLAARRDNIFIPAEGAWSAHAGLQDLPAGLSGDMTEKSLRITIGKENFIGVHVCHIDNGFQAIEDLEELILLHP